LKPGPLDSDLAGLLGLDSSACKWKLSRIKQVHGGNVVVDFVGAGGSAGTAGSAVYEGTAGCEGASIPEGDAGYGEVAIPEGDAILSREHGNCLLVVTADCMSIALASQEGIYGAVHAGWRGLVAGVIENAIDRMYGYGVSKVFAAIGPSIGKCCYKFSRNDTFPLVKRYGESVIGSDSNGKDTVDIHAAAIQAIEQSGAELFWRSVECTYCSGRYYSYRRGDRLSRQGMFVWKDS
jgi:YfiH family protein